MFRGGLTNLAVRDVDLAVRFYVETLGMKLEAIADGEATIDAGEGFRIGLTSKPGPKSSAAIRLTTKMPLSETIAILENRGVHVDHTASTPTFSDPDGNVFALVSDLA